MHDLVSALKGALDYTQLYRKQTFVIKIGGEILEAQDTLENFVEQIALLESLSIRIVLVHGGGPQATALSERLDVHSEHVGGRRVTTPAMLEVAKMVYAGQINVDLLAALRGKRVSPVGLSGIDGHLVTVKRRPPVEVEDDDGKTRTVDFGEVGDVESVDVRVLTTLLDNHYLPVVASLAADEQGNPLNVNADVIAESLATALGAQKLLFLTTSPGLLRDVNDEASLVAFADPDMLVQMMESGAIQSGMKPKIESCLRAVRGGVRRTHILDGRKPDSLLLELFTGAGCGTMIVEQAEMASYREHELETQPA